jgi:integrase/recombinase XerC
MESNESDAVATKLLQGYLDHLAHERRLSKLTSLNYARDIQALLRAANTTALGEIQVHDLRRYIAALHGKGLGGRSLARMLSAWRGFFDYLARDHGFKQNPAAGLRPPKSPKRLPKALSPEQAQLLVEIEAGDALAVRDKAILELFYSSGLRLAELVGLTPEAIDRNEGVITVTGKGNKTRVVPVGRHALAAIAAWLPLRAQILKAGESALFVNKNGKRLSPRAVQQRMKMWSIKQGININVHPHVLRHSFASHVLQSSGDLRAVQEMLGHASIASTQVYTHLDFQHLAKVYDAAHPRAKKR